MDTSFWDKATLYGHVDTLRKHLTSSLGLSFPINAKAMAMSCTNNLIIKEIPFQSDKICGILYRGNNSTSIALNAQRSPQMQNFDCMHELIHYFFHDINFCQRICSDENGTSGKIEQDTYIEWQANEGSAQFLVPYQEFIPAYVSLSRKHAHNMLSTVDVCDILAGRFYVSQKVILNRIDSLNYEIYNYLHGVPLSKVPLRSKGKLKKNGWDLQHKKDYCRICLSPVGSEHLFCCICGNPLTDGDFWGRMKYTNTGAGYMIYPGVKLNEQGQTRQCLLCKNEEHVNGAKYCMICGKPAINQCTYAIIDSDQVSCYGDQCRHQEALPGNARFCPYCGSQTTFLEADLLTVWDAPINKNTAAALDFDDTGELPFL